MESPAGGSSPHEFPLSLEIVTQILFHLDPLDINEMRAVCRSTYKATHTKAVWRAALERVIVQYGIFRPTFPLDEMSKDDLEHAACGPHRFVEHVEKNSAERYKAYQNRTFLPREPEYGQSYTVTNMALVPGGRFLLTSGNGSVCLWDLGHNFGQPIKPFPIAVVEGNEATLEAMCPSVDGKQLVLAVKTIVNNSDHLLDIYQIDPVSDEPNFDSKASFLFPFQDLQNALFVAGPPSGDGRIKSVHVNEDLVIVYCQPWFIAWNWMKGTAFRWEVDDPLDEIYVCDKVIIARSVRGLFGVWDVPAWFRTPARLDCRVIPSIRLNPRGSLGQAMQGGVTLCGTPPWQQKPTFDPHMCVLLNNEPEGTPFPMLYRYSLRRMGKPMADRFLPSCVPAMAGIGWSVYGRPNSSSYATGASPLIHCGGKLVVCSRSDMSTFMATVLDIPYESSQNVLMHTSTILTTPIKFPDGPYTGKQFGFCPISGRLVYSIFREDGEDEPETEIHVHDYPIPLQYLR